MENKLWISGNRRAFSTAPQCTKAKRWTATEQRGAPPRKHSACRQKGRSEPETSERKAQNSCAPRTITTRGASRRARIVSKTKPFATGNEPKSTRKGAMANRLCGGTAEVTQLRSRSNAEGAEMRSAGLSGRQRTAVSRRPPTAPAALLSIIDLARAISPTAGAFSLCSRPVRRNAPHDRPLLLLLAHRLPAVIPRSCSFCAQLRHAAPPRGRLLVYKGSKRTNK